MEDGLIKDTMIKVSSTHPESKKVWGRLHSNEGSWTPNDDYKSQWFQVNFEPEVKRITHIATQGNGKNHYWVKEYYVMYKKKGASTLQQYMENNKLVVRRNFLGEYHVTFSMLILLRRACSSRCTGLSSVVYHGWEGKCSEILATPSYSKIRG